MTRAALTLVFLGLALFVPEVARAASPWVETTGAKMRLLAGSREGDEGSPVLWAAVEIVLEAGWKTYWRSPGDSGIPPRIDTSLSRNLKSVDVLWPSPSRFGSGPGASIGYKDRVVLPLRIEPEDPRAPVLLSVELLYGVCDTLCVPAEGKGSLVLFGAGPEAQQIEAARARVPPSRIGPVAAGELGVTDVDLVPQDGASFLRFLVDSGDQSPETVDLFVEGPEGTDLPIPERAADSNGRLEYRILLEETEDETVAQWPLKLTVVSARRSIEQHWRMAPTMPR